MKLYLRWIPKKVTRGKETLRDDGKNALKYPRTLLEHDKLESKKSGPLFKG